MTAIPHISVPADRFTHAIENGAAHMRPLFVAARNAGVGLCLVPQGRNAFTAPTDRSTILLVGDDMHTSVGPGGFHQKSIKRFVRRCRAAVIVSCAPLIEAYASAATSAVIGMDVILVETRIEHETAWKDLIEAEKPGIAMLLATVEPAGGVQ